MSQFGFVPGRGTLPNKIMLVGEAPGRVEVSRGEPFVGPSGREQDRYLRIHGLNCRNWYCTNLVKEPIEKDGWSEREKIEEWSPVLEEEIRQCSPGLIISVGSLASAWFLGGGGEISLSDIHGIPHFSSKTLCPVLPIYHPAAGLWDPECKPFILWDYAQVALYAGATLSGKEIHVPEDEYLGDEFYNEVEPKAFAHAVLSTESPVIALDTENTESGLWSIQISDCPGHALMCRADHLDFPSALLDIADTVEKKNITVVMHNSMFDLCVLRNSGIDIRNIWDTMYAAYILRTEPKGLKPLARRWCGMNMWSFDEIMMSATNLPQINYLKRVSECSFEAQPIVVRLNDGTARIKNPWPAQARAKSILKSIRKGNPPSDLKKAWESIDCAIREPAEAEFGVFPSVNISSLYSTEPGSVVWYGCRDADATLRLYRELKKKVDPALMSTGNKILPIFADMVHNGLPVSVSRLESLYSSMDGKCFEVGHKISARFFGGRPFNPKSPPQVSRLLKLRGIKSPIETSTGKGSTSKNAIEQFRYTDEAIGLVFEWREYQHVRDSFAKPLLALARKIDPVQGAGTVLLRSDLDPTRTHTRRLAARDPNVLAIPVRTEIGREVRKCFVCEGDQVFASLDLSQIEARCLAHESRDPNLIRVFDQGLDIHIDTAAKLFKVGVEEVSKDQRRVAKTINYGVFYGITSRGLQVQLKKEGLDYSLPLCEDMLQTWYRVFRGVDLYQKRVHREVRRTGVVLDYWGMPRYLPNIWSSNAGERAEAERHAVSHKIQGLAQGMLYNSIIHLDKKVREINEREGAGTVLWSLQVHDEILLRFPCRLWEEVNKAALDSLTGHHGIDFAVPVEAGGDMGKSWGELK